jgi:hypothetical protein
MLAVRQGIQLLRRSANLNGHRNDYASQGTRPAPPQAVRFEPEAEDAERAGLRLRTTAERISGVRAAFSSLISRRDRQRESEDGESPGGPCRYSGKYCSSWRREVTPSFRNTFFKW